MSELGKNHIKNLFKEYGLEIDNEAGLWRQE